MHRFLLPLALVIALMCPAAVQAHELSSSTARAEARYYAEILIEEGVGTRYKIGSCRRHSGHAVSCAYKVTGPGGFRCGGRVRTAYLSHKSPDTISRVVGDTCE